MVTQFAEVASRACVQSILQRRLSLWESVLNSHRWGSVNFLFLESYGQTRLHSHLKVKLSQRLLPFSLHQTVPILGLPSFLIAGSLLHRCTQANLRHIKGSADGFHLLLDLALEVHIETRSTRKLGLEKALMRSLECRFVRGCGQGLRKRRRGVGCQVSLRKDY